MSQAEDSSMAIASGAERAVCEKNHASPVPIRTDRVPSVGIKGLRSKGAMAATRDQERMPR
jgi:hypothetical protein